MTDPRRKIPGTGTVLDDPRLAAAVTKLGRDVVKQAIHEVQRRVRFGNAECGDIVELVLAALPQSASSLRCVRNATGVLLHTNLGRAPLSEAAIDALGEAAGTTDVELDLASGQRGTRGAGVMSALRAAVPEAEAAHAVNNGAAGLVLAATALASGQEIILARGEMVEIGDGFRIPELLESTGARLREVGTTNRVRLRDYQDAIGPDTGFILKIHPSNFVIRGFTSSVSCGALHDLGVPVVADIGSGLLRPHVRFPDEPDAATTLSGGADMVIFSGDKLLGGPQAGLLLGEATLIQRLRRHPLARALRMDKLGLAALEATLRGPENPVRRALRQDQATLRQRAENLAVKVKRAGVDVAAVESAATVGGGGAPEVTLPSAALSLPEWFAKRLRCARHPVLTRLENGRCMADLFAIAPQDDAGLADAIIAAAR